MRFFFVFLLATAHLFSGLSYAQEDAFLMPFNPLVVEEKAESAEEALGLKDTTPKTHAKAIIKKMYKHCVKHKPPIIEQHSLEALCGCTAAETIGLMKPEEIETMLTDTKEGLFQRERMVSLAYIPCMEHPIRDIVKNDCLSNKNFVEGLRTPVQVCNCIANNMGEYMLNENSYVTQDILNDKQKDATAYSVMMRFLENLTFKQQLAGANRRCVQKHQLGWDFP